MTRNPYNVLTEDEIFHCSFCYRYIPKRIEMNQKVTERRRETLNWREINERTKAKYLALTNIPSQSKVKGLILNC